MSKESMDAPLLLQQHLYHTEEVQFGMDSSSSASVEPLEIGDGHDPFLKQTMISDVPQPSAKRSLYRLLAALSAVVVSLGMAYNVGRQAGKAQVVGAAREEMLDDCLRDEEDDDRSATQLIENEVAYFDDHPNTKRPFSLLLFRNETYEGIYDAAYIDKLTNVHIQDFTFRYMSTATSEAFINLSWYAGQVVPYKQIYVARKQFAEDVVEKIPLVDGDFLGLGLLRDTRAMSPTTSILFQEGDGTWEFRCEVLQPQECIDLATACLVRVTEAEFVSAVEQFGN